VAKKKDRIRSGGSGVLTGHGDDGGGEEEVCLDRKGGDAAGAWRPGWIGVGARCHGGGSCGAAAAAVAGVIGDCHNGLLV
jgi:hypothetical protein